MVIQQKKKELNEQFRCRGKNEQKETNGGVEGQEDNQKQGQDTPEVQRKGRRGEV